MTLKLGKLEVLPANSVWAGEAQVFTPWLSQNLKLLAEALGIDELQLKGTEMAAGDFRLDILAEDTDGSPVLIENQFGPTDHKHLGQLISYVASLKSRATVVWVAERFRDSHRGAIDWLNASTNEGFDFFAVEIEALRIGDSDPAPFFNVVAKPNAWTKSVGAISRRASTGEIAEGEQLKMTYWSSFSDYLKGRNAPFAVRPGNTDHWHTFAIGRSGVAISATFNPAKRRIGVELYLGNDATKSGIRQLESERDAIEREFGEPLDWQELPGRKASRIVVYREGVDPADEAAFEDLHAWMLARMEAFRRVFTQRVKALTFTSEPDGAAE